MGTTRGKAIKDREKARTGLSGQGWGRWRGRSGAPGVPGLTSDSRQTIGTGFAKFVLLSRRRAAAETKTPPRPPRVVQRNYWE